MASSTPLIGMCVMAVQRFRAGAGNQELCPPGIFDQRFQRKTVLLVGWHVGFFPVTDAR